MCMEEHIQEVVWCRPTSDICFYSYSISKNTGMCLPRLQRGLASPIYNSIQWKREGRESWVLVNLTELLNQPDNIYHQTAPRIIKSASFGVQPGHQDFCISSSDCNVRQRLRTTGLSHHCSGLLLLAAKSISKLQVLWGYASQLCVHARLAGGALKNFSVQTVLQTNRIRISGSGTQAPDQ